MKHFILFLLTSLSSQSFAQENAEAIFAKATSQLLTGDMELSVDVKVTDKNGRVKEKGFDVLTAKFGDTEKTKMSMQKPERAQGIIIVLTRLPEEMGVIEIFTPANGKTRKMKATPENLALVGSDFSISSYASKDQGELTYRFLGEGEVNAKVCYKIEVLEKSSSDGGKAHLMIEKDSFKIVQILVFDEDGTKLSMTALSDYQSINGSQGKLQPMLIKSEDFKTKKHSELRILKVASRKDLKEQDFSIQ